MASAAGSGGGAGGGAGVIDSSIASAAAAAGAGGFDTNLYSRQVSVLVVPNQRVFGLPLLSVSHVMDWHLLCGACVFTRGGQVAVYGEATMQKLTKMNILIIGMKGLGVEAGKTKEASRLDNRPRCCWC